MKEARTRHDDPVVMNWQRLGVALAHVPAYTVGVRYAEGNDNDEGTP